MGTLYILGAPEGDPADLTLRAVRILGQATLVVAEDIGRAQRLLAHHQIATPLSGTDVSPEVLGGGDIALLVSGHYPGGTPPAQRLVQAAHERGLSVEPVPGPSLPITALVISGLPADGFVYLGKLPPQGVERRNLLASVASERRTLVVQAEFAYLASTLSDLHSALSNRPLCIVSASDSGTDVVYRGTLDEAPIVSLDLPGDALCVFVIGGYRQKTTRWTEEEIHAELQVRLAEGQPPREIARTLAVESGWPRRQIYRMAVDNRQ